MNDNKEEKFDSGDIIEVIDNKHSKSSNESGSINIDDIGVVTDYATPFSCDEGLLVEVEWLTTDDKERIGCVTNIAEWRLQKLHPYQINITKITNKKKTWKKEN